VNGSPSTIVLMGDGIAFGGRLVRALPQLSLS
jgi:hypothetical protein